MSLELLLEEKDIAEQESRAKLQYRNMLNLQQSKLSQIFGNNSKKDLDLGESTSLMFNGIYALINKKISQNSEISSKLPLYVRRAYSAMVASEAILQNLRNQDNYDIAPGFDSYVNKYLQFNIDDSSCASNLMQGFVEYLQNHRKYNNVGYMLTDYYSTVSESIKEILNTLDTSQFNILSNMSVVSKNFKMKGLSISEPNLSEERNISSSRQNKRNIQERVRETVKYSPPERLPLKKVLFEEVIGNELAKKEIADNIQFLMAYRLNEKVNLNFEKKRLKQYHNLIGLPGGGKSLLLKAAHTYIDFLSNKYKTPYECVTLKFGSEMQDGPLLTLQYQLQVISDPNKIHLVLIDEADKMFKSRNEPGMHDAERKTITEMFEFMDGITYNNYGNYMFVLCTNIPARMDPAMIDRIGKGTYRCDGPVTPEQKAQTLKLYLDKYAKEGGKIETMDYVYLGNLGHELKMNARKLAGAIGEVTRDNSITSYTDEFYHQDTSYAQQKSIDSSSTIYYPVTQQKVVAAMYKLANTKDDMDEITRGFEGLSKY